MWGTALGLIAQPISERLRRLIRRGLLMALAVALAALAFLCGLGAVYAVLEPRIGPAAAAAVLGAGLAFLSLALALLASRRTSPGTTHLRSPTAPALTGHGSAVSWQILAAAFAAGIAAGRKC